MCLKQKYLSFLFSFYFLTHQILEGQHHITLLREMKVITVITAITITVLSSQQQYHLRLFPLPWSHSGVLPITETCPARLV